MFLTLRGVTMARACSYCDEENSGVILSGMGFPMHVMAMPKVDRLIVIGLVRAV